MSTIKVNTVEPSSGSTVTVSGLTAANADLDTPTVTGGTITGITDLAVADGGTGASTAGGALTNLGVSAAAQTVLDDATVGDMRTTLGVPSTTEAILDTIMDAKGDLIVASAADTPAILTAGANDTILIADSAQATGLKYGTVNSFTEDTAPDLNADYVVTYDGSAAGHKKVLLGRLGPVRMTTVATTSGTSHDFTGIPSWVTRITVNFAGVSTNSTAALIIQLGDSGGIENTGYTSGSMPVTSSSAGTAVTSTAGFLAPGSMVAASTIDGHAVITLVDSATNTWAYTHNILRSDNRYHYGAGSKALSGTLTQIRLTTTTGTDTFDAGLVNVLYE